MMKTLKRSILRTLQHAGAFRWIGESQWRTEKLLILCYHGVSLEDEHEWHPTFSMPQSIFETRLEQLRSGGYTVLPLEEALSKLYSNTLAPKSVAITFDDGMYNFYVRALPVLQRYNFPVTLYLTTYYCYHNLPVFNLLCSYMLWKSRDDRVSANPRLGLSRPFDLTTASGRHLAWKEIYAHAARNKLNAVGKNDLAKGLAEHLHLDFDELLSKRLFHLMTPDEIRDISKKGVDIQLHTHRHRTAWDRLLYQREIIENRNKITELTGKKAQHFCYPSGVYGNQILPWLSEQGVSSATTCDPGLARAKTNPLLLPRYLDSSNVSPIEFESWLTGVGAILPRNPFHR